MHSECAPPRLTKLPRLYACVLQAQWEIVVQLDRATDRGATSLRRPSSDAAGQFGQLAPTSASAPPLSCDPDGELSLPCLQKLLHVLPDDAFSYAAAEAQTSGVRLC